MKNKLTKILLLFIVVCIFACNLVIVPVSAADGDTITLKAGTYRFNDILVFDNAPTFTTQEELDALMEQINNFIYPISMVTVDGYVPCYLTFYNVQLDEQNNYSCLRGIVGEDLVYMYVDGIVDGVAFDGWDEIVVDYYNSFDYIISNDIVVNETMGNLFIANTNYNEVNGDDVRMLIKAGRYQFNDSLSFSTSINENDYNNIHFTYNNSEYHGIRFISQSASGTDITTMTFLNGNNIADGTLIYAKQVLSDGSVSEIYNGYQVVTPVVVDVLSDQEVPIYIALEFLYNVQIVDSGGGTCPTLPELLLDYNGSFDSIVDMLNSTNYDEYSDYINYVRDSAYNDGASSNFGESVLGSTFQMPLHALNQWVLFETSTGADVTMGGVFTAVIALSLLIILLKMFSGG